jgi:protein-disulfide isomerase/uncharacterized membrane protein
MTKRHVRATLIALCVLGLAASAASTYVHYRLIDDSSYSSFCDINDSVNCETAYRSAYGTLAGIPVALGGLIWFVLALLLTFVSEPVVQPDRPAGVPRPSKGRRAAEPASAGSPVSGYLFALSTVALAVVLYLAYASFFVLGTVCVLCVLTYVAVVGIFLVSGAANPAGLASLPRLAARDLRRLASHPAALTVAILYLAGAASAIAFFPRDAVSMAAATTPASSASGSSSESTPEPAPQLDQLAGFEAWLDMQPRVPLAGATDGAKVVIVKFNDYQCPPCRQTFMQYKPILQKFEKSHPGQVKFVTRDFPLEPECNSGGGHAAACEAAAAVRMARVKGRAEALEDWLFDNQPAMSAELVRKGVREVGQVANFDAQYPSVLEQVRSDSAYGRQLGVNRTPTFFINGVKIEGGLLPHFFEAAIAHELKRAQASAKP